MKNPLSFLNKIREKNYTNTHSFFLQTDTLSTNKKISSLTALKYNRDSLYVNKGFEKRAEKVSEVDFILRDSKGEIVVESEQLDLLNNPNEQSTGAKFWKLATQYRDITGMAVIKKVTNKKVFKENQEVTSLELLNSGYVDVVEDQTTGLIKHFAYNNPITKKSENIPYEQCIYWHIPDPINPNQPLPLLLAGILTIDSSLENEKQYHKTLKNGGTVDGLFRFKEGLNKEQIDTLKRDYAQLLRDNKGSNVPMILGGDANFERVALSPTELQAIDNKKLLLDDLVAITGVPKVLLGISSGETYANAETSYKIFLREVIKPLVNDLVDVLNWKLIADDYTLGFVDPTPENIEENLKKAETGSRINALTLNEKRELLGLSAVANGDEVEKAPEYNSVQEETKKKNLKSNKKFNHPLQSEEFRDEYYAKYVKGLTKNNTKFKKELLKYLRGQKVRVMNAIPQLPNTKSMTKNEFGFSVLNETLEITYMTPLLETMEEIAREEGIKTAKLFNEEFYYTSKTDKMVQDRFKFFATTVNSTTANVLEKEFDNWFKNNESIAELSERISGVYDFEKSEKWRADMIVNTEVSSITNMTKGDVYEQLDIPIKIWVHRAGIQGGVRDTHSMMDGEEVKKGQYFSNGMLHPHDPAGGAEENINCMCTW